MTKDEKENVLEDNQVLNSGGKGTRSQTLRLAQLAVLVAISSLLVFISFPIIPGAPMEYDMANVPILFAAFVFGTPAGLLVLVIAAFIQAFLLGHNGWIGFLMHVISSATMIFVARGISAKFKMSKTGMIIGLVAGSVAVMLIMIPLNFIFMPKVMMNVPIAEAFSIFISGLGGNIDPTLYSELAVTAYNTVKGMLLVAIMPFNLLKCLLNSLLFYLLYRAVPMLTKSRQQ